MKLFHCSTLVGLFYHPTGPRQVVLLVTGERGKRSERSTELTRMSDMNRALGELPTDSWMSLLPDALQEVPLFHLAIPGSHNTVTYCLDKNIRSPVDLTQPDMLQKLDKFMKPVIRPFLYKWAVTQESSIKQQLNSGVRYCDLRIARRPKTHSRDLYFYHGVYTTVTVEAVLREIKEWLDIHLREVVILSFSHFQDLDDELHNHLTETIKNIFTSKLCPRTEAVTLKNLWQKCYQVIISYDHSIISFHDQLWAHIPYWWANKCKAEALVQEFECRKERGRPAGFFVVGINLTEDLKYICSHPAESLKDLVMSTYPVLLKWVGTQRPGPSSSSINIIAGDFVAESALVHTVISLNEHLLNK
ncbi:PI-PLC X domain-containing protein 1-like [Arapaima gigas]